MKDNLGQLKEEMRQLAASIPDMIDNVPAAQPEASTVEQHVEPPAVIYPFREDATAYEFQLGIAHVFSLAKPWIEGLHGPLENWQVGYAYAAESGNYLGRDDRNRPPLCDGKREHGGTIERYLLAHWRISRWLEEPMDWPIMHLAIDLISYGHAFAAMIPEDIPGLPFLVDPQDFCFSASTPPDDRPAGEA